MKSLAIYLGALLTLGVGSSLAHAQYPFPVRQYPFYCPVPPLRAPDFCSTPGYYTTNCYGQPIGPNYNLYPPFQPFQGMIPLPGCPGSPAAVQQQQAQFPSHPFARSPRDFYMME